MATYVVHVRTPRAPAEVFAYMADLRNFAEWDPGVLRSEQTAGDGPARDAVFSVTVKSVGGSMTLDYRITDYVPPERIVADARARFLRSLDTITVRPDGSGSIVTYDARLTLNGVLGIADPVLGLAFRRIADRAVDGLVAALDGERADGPAAG